MVLQNDAVVALWDPVGDAAAMPRGFYGQTHGKPYERRLRKCPVYRSGKISARYL